MEVSQTIDLAPRSSCDPIWQDEPEPEAQEIIFQPVDASPALVRLRFLLLARNVSTNCKLLESFQIGRDAFQAGSFA